MIIESTGAVVGSEDGFTNSRLLELILTLVAPANALALLYCT